MSTSQVANRVEPTLDNPPHHLSCGDRVTVVDRERGGATFVGTIEHIRTSVSLCATSYMIRRDEPVTFGGFVRAIYFAARHELTFLPHAAPRTPEQDRFEAQR